MQAALPLDKPVQAHSLSLAVLVLSAIVVTPSPIPKPADAKIAGPVLERSAGSIFSANHMLNNFDSNQINLDSGDQGSISINLAGQQPGVQESGEDKKSTDLETGGTEKSSFYSELADKQISPTDKARAAITQHALSWLGVPYLWGGESHAGIDCSALVQRVYFSQGIQLPRTSYEQFRMGVGVAAVNLQPGDLVFFSTAGSGASHVGIYLGNGEFLSATRRQVEVQSMENGYWKNAYRGSRRVLDATAYARQSQLPF